MAFQGTAFKNYNAANGFNTAPAPVAPTTGGAVPTFQDSSALSSTNLTGQIYDLQQVLNGYNTALGQGSSFNSPITLSNDPYGNNTGTSYIVPTGSGQVGGTTNSQGQTTGGTPYNNTTGTDQIFYNGQYVSPTLLQNQLNSYTNSYDTQTANTAAAAANPLGNLSSLSQLVPSEVQAASTGVLNQYFNTPAYQLQFGNAAAQQMAANPNQVPSPQSLFQQDPGYQFSLDQGMQQIQQKGAAQGLLNSGTTLQALGDYVTGDANQEYQSWNARQQSGFNNYQNQLASLAGLGSNFATGGGSASTGSQASSNNMSAGQIASGLYSSLGTNVANTYMQGASATSQALMQGGVAQGQIAAANQQASQTSMGGILGSVLGAFI